MKAFLIYGLLFSNLASAAEALTPKVELRALDVSAKDQVSFKVKVIPSQEGLTFEARQDQTLYPMLSTSKVPINLVVLAENSGSSARENLDSYLVALGGNLRKGLAKGSFVSFGLYNQKEAKVLVKQKRADQFEVPKFQLQTSQLSVSYQKMLEVILDGVNSNLPTLVWVFSSGNILLDAKAIEGIKKKGLEVEIFTLNTFLMSDLTSIVERQNALLKENKIQVRAFSKSPEIPVGYFQGSFQASSKSGGVENFQLNPVVQGKSSPGILLTVKLYSFTPLYLRWWFITLSVLALSALTFYGFWKITRPRVCRDCKKSLRNGDKTCFFCDKSPQFYLQIRDSLTTRWIPLRRTVVRVGTNLRSQVSLKRFNKESRKEFFEIRTLSSLEGQLAIIPKTNLVFGGKRLNAERLIANGDQWSVGEREFSLVRRAYE